MSIVEAVQVLKDNSSRWINEAHGGADLNGRKDISLAMASPCDQRL
jgi:uncharacterized membrane protein